MSTQTTFSKSSGGKLAKPVSGKHVAKRHRDQKLFANVDPNYPFGFFARQNFKRGATARMCTRAGVRCVSRGVHDVQSAIYQALVGAIVRPAVLVARLGDRSTLKMRDVEYGIEHSRRAPRSLLYAIPYAEHKQAEEASRLAQEDTKSKARFANSLGVSKHKNTSAQGGSSSSSHQRPADASMDTTSASSSVVAGGDNEAENEKGDEEAEQEEQNEEEQEPEDDTL